MLVRSWLRSSISVSEIWLQMYIVSWSVGSHSLRVGDDRRLALCLPVLGAPSLVARRVAWVGAIPLVVRLAVRSRRDQVLLEVRRRE